MNKAMPSIEYLRECFDMNESGLLTWKSRPSHHFVNDVAERRWNSTYAGKPAGHVGKDGYMVVTLLEHRYRVHRVVFALANNDDPADCMVDHTDGDILNNTPENLRKASNTENQFNQKIAARNVSGVKGVLWDKKAAQWRASIRHNGKRFQKNFRSIDEAAAWADEVRRGVHGEFARSE